MNNKEYFENAMKLVKVEKRISKLEREIQNYIETYVVDDNSIEKEDLLNLGHKYSKLYVLKKNKEDLFSKVAIGYKYIQD